MKLGLQLNRFDWDGGPRRFASTLVETAEEAGFDRIAVADHVWQHPIVGGPEANEPECYATLSFLPQFVDPSAGVVAARMLLFGLVFVGIGVVCDGLIAWFSGGLGESLARRPRLSTAVR